MSNLQNFTILPWNWFYSSKSISLFKGVKLFPWLSIIVFATILWNAPIHQGMNTQAWHLLIIFLGTIISIICNILPIGAVALLGMVACVTTQTLTLHDCLRSFGHESVWLVVFAFFIAKGFIKSGLGTRISYVLILFLGRTSLGLAYGLVFADFLLASTIPSNTARGIGVIFPIVKSLVQEFGSSPSKKTERKIGAFLIKTCYQTNVITSAMFMTALAGNLLIVKLAADVDIIITWRSWALGAFVPGLTNLFLIPLLLYYIYPPELKSTLEAPNFARRKLSEQGPLTYKEIFVIITFFFLLGLWIFGNSIGISAATTALIGCGILICSQVLDWEDILNEKNAWNTLIWFGILVMMAEFLTDFGFVTWLSNCVLIFSFTDNYMILFPIICLMYYYSHYFFASSTAHITAMYAAFLSISLASHTPPLLAAFSLGMLSNLSACLTHYGNGSAPVYYGAGYLSMREWWYLGGIISVVNLLVWLLIGGIWWKIIGFW